MTAIEQIVAWANEPERPVWWKHAIRLALVHQRLEQEHFELLYQISRMESGLDDQDEHFATYQAPVLADGFVREENPVVLRKLGPVTNVSSLAPDQELEFSSQGLTVVYGDNGAGKSSYAKILKNACLTRGELPSIMGNVFTGDKTTSSAAISINVGGEDSTVNWTLEQESISELKSIRVFDTTSAAHYVEKEGIIDYKPSGLHLLDELNKACEYVKEKAGNDLRGASAEWKKPEISALTSAGLFLKQLSDETTAHDIQSFCATEQELTQLKGAQERLIQLKRDTPEKVRAAISSRLNRVKPFLSYLRKVQEKVSNDVLQDIADKKDTYLTAKTVAEQAREQTFTGLPLPGTGNDAWKLMWQAAKDYVSSMEPEHEFPAKEGGHCPLCMQDVCKSTAERLKSFNDYVASTVQKEADKALSSLKDALALINQITIDFAPYSAVIDELKVEFSTASTESQVEESESRLDSLLQSFSRQIDSRKAVACSTPASTHPVEAIDTEIVDKLANLVSDLEEQSRAVKNNDEVQKTISALEKNYQELDAKKIILEQHENISNEVARLITVKRLSKISDNTRTAAITRLSTAINDELVTGQLREAFTEELWSLGFRNYNVDAATRGDRGNQKFKIRLNSEAPAKVDVIASEGEQKCLALASIFAELKADGRKSGVVFDDPVTSLDHRWTQMIAKRLITESEGRQVVIFTHDIVFLKLIIEQAESQNKEIHIQSLDRNRRATGYVSRSYPWDALTTTRRVKKLKSDLRLLRKIDDSGTEAEYKTAVYNFYGHLREAWERLVEERLLNGVVTRFGRSIQTQRLSKLVDDIKTDDIARISQGMSKCSTYFKGHDSAPALREPFPPIEEVSADLDALDTFDKELIDPKTRKRS